ncbi:hypothetical protein [Paenibacillus sp. SI8]
MGAARRAEERERPEMGLTEGEAKRRGCEERAVTAQRGVTGAARRAAQRERPERGLTEGEASGEGVKSER